MTTSDLLKGMLRRIGAYQSGDTIPQTDLQDSLDTINDLLDSWSTNENHVFGSNENILQWTAGKSQYKVGNPTCTAIGEPPFIGTLSGGSPTISGVTQIPADLKVGATLTDLANVIPAGTTVTAIGATTVTMSANATATPSIGPDTITYTIPGDFAIARPLRITNGFTRINSLDFTLDVYESQDRFLEILYKAQPGPWPTVAWYNNLMPYGVLNVYQTPGSNAEVHLFTDTILTNLTLTQTVIMPQGYARALKWCGAAELWPEYHGVEPLPPALAKFAAEGLAFIKSLNAQPAVVARYDPALTHGDRPDGSWILHGGYR